MRSITSLVTRHSSLAMLCLALAAPALAQKAITKNETSALTESFSTGNRTLTVASGGTLNAVAGSNIILAGTTTLSGAITSNATLTGGTLANVTVSGNSTLSLANSTVTLPRSVGGGVTPYNVRAYGATGDGTTDDASAIASAITAAGTGGTVHFPPGDYAILTALDPLQGQTLWFAPGAILRMKPAGTYNGSGLIDVDSADVTIRGATFAGRASATGTFAVNVAAAPRVSLIDCIGSTTLARLVIFTAGSDYGRVIRCTSPGTGPGAYASNHVEFNDSDGGLVDQSHFYGGGLNGVEIYQNNGNAISGVRVVNSSFTDVGASGVNAYGAYGVVVAGNVFRRTATHGVFLTTGEVNTALTSYGNSIVGNYFEECGVTTAGGVPIYLDASRTRIIGNTMLALDRSILDGNYGITLNSGDENVADSNHLEGLNGGIFLNSGSRAIISQNVLVNLGAAGASVNAITIDGTAAQIVRNVIRDTRSGASRGMDIGIVLGATSSGCDATGNIYVNLKGTGLFDSGTGNTRDGSGLTNLSASNLAAGTIPAARMPAHTGDATSSAGSVALTLATVNSNVGTFGSATAAPVVTLNGKGLATAASNVTITPAVGSITGLGTGVATALAATPNATGGFVAFSGNIGAATGTSLAATGNISAGGSLVSTSGNITASSTGTPILTVTTNDPNANGYLALANSGASGRTWIVGTSGASAAALGGATVAGRLWVYDNNAGSTRLTIDSNGTAAFLGTTASTSSTTGAVTVAGGLGVAGTAFIGGALSVASGHYYPPQTAPGNPATGWVIYTDSGDSNKLKAKASTGTVVTLGAP